jgi:glycosyltransferase involved in cell wall biosynthesis
MLDLTVVVPVRNAEHFIDACLASIVRAAPREIIVVDGNSTDSTVARARQYPVTILSDEGRGVAAARLLGVQRAATDVVALIDVDIVLPDGALAALLAEFTEGGYTALQAGLHSVSGDGYWGQALAFHHNTGRSKSWPGVMATIFRRQALLDYGFDERFASGEDIELRWRLKRGHERLGVSRRTFVEHRFEDTFTCARGQFEADGKGLARMVLKYRWQALPLLGIPAAGAVRGIAVCVRRGQPKWIPYYVSYALLNYTAIIGTLRRGLGAVPTGGEPRVDYGRVQ